MQKWIKITYITKIKQIQSLYFDHHHRCVLSWLCHWWNCSSSCNKQFTTSWEKTSWKNYVRFWIRIKEYSCMRPIGTDTTLELLWSNQKIIIYSGNDQFCYNKSLQKAIKCSQQLLIRSHSTVLFVHHRVLMSPNTPLYIYLKPPCCGSRIWGLSGWEICLHTP